jgi:hypothetical protein
MVRKGLSWFVGLVAVSVVGTSAALIGAQAGSASLGSVRVPVKVMADGQPLAAGTYTLRLSDEAVPPVVGQTPAESHWVEFRQSGQVKGRELATVLTTDEAKQISKEGLPAPGVTRVQRLKGDEYLRIWINRAGTNYLVHLAIAPKS